MREKIIYSLEEMSFNIIDCLVTFQIYHKTLLTNPLVRCLHLSFLFLLQFFCYKKTKKSTSRFPKTLLYLCMLQRSEYCLKLSIHNGT